jgi:hypothetical protein
MGWKRSDGIEPVSGGAPGKRFAIEASVDMKTNRDN